MMFIQRQRTVTEPPGITGTARVGRTVRSLIPRLRPGDIAVLDHLDLDRASAQALVDAQVGAVVNAAAFISGRYPNLGPETLARAGVALVQIDAQDHAAISDNAPLRIHQGGLYRDLDLLAQGQELTAPLIAEAMAAARDGMATQLISFTHNSTEFLRREQDLLLHGLGMPSLATSMTDRPAVVVVDGADAAAELAGLRRYLRETDAVLIGVDRGADLLASAGHRAEVVVLTAAPSGAEQLPSASVLRAARDVLVRVAPGTDRPVLDQIERLVQRPSYLETTATSEDAALLLADRSGAETIVGVGLHARLEEFLDRQRDGLASTYLTRLKVGPKLVEASAVLRLYSGRVRGWHVAGVLVAAVAALLAALWVTPVGQVWADAVGEAIENLYDYLQGLL